MYKNPNIENLPSPLKTSLLKSAAGKIHNTVKKKNTATILNFEYFLLKQWSKVITLKTNTSTIGKIYTYSIDVTPKYFKPKT